MKLGLFASALIMMTYSAFASDLQVTTTRKVANAEQKIRSVTGKQDGKVYPIVKGKKRDEVYYAVNVNNRSFRPQPALEARYILFVERQKLGEKKGQEKIERVKGTAKLEEMPTKASVSFDTVPVELNEATIGGGYFADGGRLKANDKVLGVWIKFFDGDKEVGEYVNPTTIKQRHQWTD